jgi:gliding motility-associated-like protein
MWLRCGLALLGGFAFSCLLAGGGERPRAVAAHAHAERGGALFTPNAGQWPDEVRFCTRLDGGAVWLTAGGWNAEWWGPGRSHGGARQTAGGEVWGWTLAWEGARLDAGVSSSQPATRTESYFFGNDPSRWARNLHPAGTIRYAELYPGIDWVVRGEPGRLDGFKHEFHVAPGADPDAIAAVYAGSETWVRPDGALVHAVGPEGTWGEVVEAPPFAYQLLGTRLVPVPCSYAASPQPDGSTRVRYILGDYDPALPLVIDPELQFASYIGATADNWGFTAAYDADGRLLAGAGIRSGGGTYPTTPGAISSAALGGEFDWGISFFSADGSNLEHSTYLGGSAMEYPHSIVAGAEGDVYIMGTTGSANFPTTFGAYSTVFAGGPFVDLGGYHFFGAYAEGCDMAVVRLDLGSGDLLAGTYLGGTGNDGINIADPLNYNYGDVCRGEVNVDPTGRPWVASVTSSANFPGVAAFEPSLQGATDGVVCRLSADLSDLELSSFLGGSDDDAAYAIAFAPEVPVRAYVAGGTQSSDFISTTGGFDGSFNGVVDAFLVRLDVGGGGSGWSVADATFFGSSAYDQAYLVQVDTDNRPYLCGQTTGSINISGSGTYAANPNGSSFIVRFTPDLSATEFVTRVGANIPNGVDISPTAFLVSDCGEIYLCGWGGDTNAFNSAYATTSTTSGMPVTPGQPDVDASTDGSDFWLGILAPDATALTYGTFLGGPFSNEHVDGGTSRFDKDGTVYQAVCAGCGGYDDFPVTDGASSEVNLSTNCNLGVFKFTLGALIADIEIEAPPILCPGEPVQFVNTSIGGSIYSWTFGDLETSSTENPVHTFDQPGQWDVMLVISSAAGTEGCLAPDTAFATLTIASLPTPTVDAVAPICPGASVTLQAWESSGDGGLQWSPHPTLSTTSGASPVVTPIETTTYTVTESNVCGDGSAAVTVEVVEMETSVTQDLPMCAGDVVTLEATGGASVTWSPVTGLGSPASAVTTASPASTTTYVATLLSPEGCVAEEEVTLYVAQGLPGGTTWPVQHLCIGQGMTLQAGEGESWLWSPSTGLNNAWLQQPYATPAVSTTYVATIANACGTGTDTVYVEVVTPTASATAGDDICRGSATQISASDGVAWSWHPQALAASPAAQTTSVFPVETSTFTVFVTDEHGCVASDQVTVQVLQPPWVEAGPEVRRIDFGERIRLFGSAETDSLWWTPADLLSCSYCETPEVLSIEPGWYVLHAVSGIGCVGRDSVFVDVFYPVYVPNAFTPNNDGINDAFRVEGVDPRDFRLEIFDRWGERVFFSEDPAVPWIGDVDGGSHFAADGLYVWRMVHRLREGPQLREGTVLLTR